MTQTDTGLARATASGPDGAYLLPCLPVGPCRPEAKKKGFTSYIQSGIVLQVNTNPAIDISLTVGSVSEQVQVEAGAAMVETHTTAVGQVVDSQRAVDLPLNGRQAPTSSWYRAPRPPSLLLRNWYRPRTIRAKRSSAVAGGGLNGLSYLLDDGNHNDPFNNLNLPLPFPDALQEFKVETSALPAQYGHHSAGAAGVYIPGSCVLGGVSLATCSTAANVQQRRVLWSSLLNSAIGWSGWLRGIGNFQ